MRFDCFVLIGLLGAVALLGAGSVWAVPNQPTLDELLKIEPPKLQPNSRSRVRPDRGQTPPGLIPVRDLQRQLTDEELADQFKQAVQLMDVASDKLGLQFDAGLSTQRVQESVLIKLDQVIAVAEQLQCQAYAGGQKQPKSGDQGSSGNVQQRSGSSPIGNQAHRGNASPGQVDRIDPDKIPLEELRQEWGHLGARLRAELMQGIGEPFSPVYRSLTESYFRRLAEEGK